MSTDPSSRLQVANVEPADSCERPGDIGSISARLSFTIFRLDPDLRCLSVSPVSPSVESVLGIQAAGWIGRTVSEVGLPTGVHDSIATACREVFSSGRARSLELATDGEDLLVRLTPECDTEGSVETVLCIAQDVTEIRRAERERAMADEFLRILNESHGTTDLLRAVALFLQRRSGCEAVGIRLSQDGDYPYFEARGFPPEFVRLENQLCSRDHDGRVVLDAQRVPALDCMCGVVIRGRTDASKSFFSPGGSFWTNCTTELLATTSEADRQAATRNRCNGMGYESVALIPLRLGEAQLGLLQLNDHRRDRHSAESIVFWERLANYLAVAIAKSRANDALRQSEERLRLASRAAEATEAQFAAFMSHSPTIAWMKDEDGRYLYRNRPFERVSGAESEDCRGKTDFDLWPPETARQLRDNDLAVLAGGEGLQVVETVQEENGELSTWLNSKFPFQDGSGRRYIGGIGVDITARKRAEEERERLLAQLDAERARWRVTVDSMLDLLATCDAEGRVTYINPAYSRLIGRYVTPGLPLEKHADHFQLYRPDGTLYESSELPLQSAALSGEDVRGVEVVHRTQDGQEFIGVFNAAPLRDKTGRVFGAVTVGRDVTEERRAEAERERLLAELREANGRLAAANLAAEEQASLAKTARADAERQAAQLGALLENLNEAVNIHDASGRLIMRNRKAQEITGIAEQVEGIDSPVPVAYLNLDGTPLPSDRLPCALALRDEKPDYSEYILVRADGSRRRLTFSTGTVRDETGRIVLALGVYRDVTERREMEQSLRESEEQFRALAENSPDLIARFDREHRRVYVNAAVERELKIPREELLGRCYQDTPVIPPEQADFFDEQIRTVFETGVVNRVQYASKTRGGNLCFDWLIVPEFDASGRVVTVLSINHDVTELYRVTEELRRLSANLESEVEKRSIELQVSSAELDAFSYSISHNVRAPLRHIQGYAQALVDDYGDRLDEAGRDYANRLGESAVRLDGVIRDLVGYARICRAQLRPEYLTLGTALEEADARLRAKAWRRGPRPNLAGLDAEVLADREILVGVLTELLDNAGKFVAPGRESTVRVWAERREGRVRLWVADNGAGIAPDHQDRVFRMFERLSPVGQGDGNGIGLAIVRKGVERLGGTLGVESVLGEGSRFWIELPLATRAPTTDSE